MITITRRLAYQLRAVFRRVFGAARGFGPPLCFSTGPDGMRVSSRFGDAAVEYHAPGDYPAEQIAVPFEFLAACEGRNEQPVTIEAFANGHVVVGWRDGSVPQMVRYENAAPTDMEMPEQPDRWAENPPALLRALDDAMATTDPDSTRFALGCIQLRGNSGTMAATDGRQMLLHSGFTFPWEDDLLIPKTTVFGCRELPQDQPVGVQRADDWVAFQIEPWTIYLQINKEGRFPDIERHIGRPADAVARCEFTSADAEFLANTLPKLPGDDQFNWPVTLDLNGAVVVRAKAQTQAEPTEVVLSQSTSRGEPLRINTNRKYLARALKLGFREVLLYGPKTPVLCRDDRRTYVWALLEPESAIGPAEKAIRINSGEPGQELPAQNQHPKPRKRRNTLSENSTEVGTESSNGNNQAAASTAADSGRPIRRAKAGKPGLHDVAALIEQAEAVRDSLRETLSKTAALIQAIKRHRHQSRLIENTLASLRQLKSIGV